MTNYERIKEMSIEEMAEFLEFIFECSFDQGRGFGDCTFCEYTKGKGCPCNDPQKWLKRKVRK